MIASAVRGLNRFNWDGDHVVFKPIVPSSRPVVGRKQSYAIDVREFLVTANNAVIRETLDVDIRKYLGQTSKSSWARFTARKKGCFDFRASVINAWVGDHVRYSRKEGSDPWQFPDETLTVRSGDCEDRAFLIASLLLASGISGYHVRVALGHVRSSTGERFDHAWVMYKSERGRWLLIEPLLRTRRGLTETRPEKGSKHRGRRGTVPRGYKPPSQVVEYVPEYLLNAEHLWSVTRSPSASFERVASKKWRRMDPAFAGEVHRTILHRALQGVASQEMIAALDERFTPALGIVGPAVDASDRGNYDPTDHFDNGLIDESWQRVEQRLARFRANRSDYTSFAQAAHGIADFYAHSSYMHFAWVKGPPQMPEPRAEPYDPDRLDDLLHDTPDYTAGDGLTDFDMTSDKLSINSQLWKKGKQAAAELWSGRIISGRYGQPGDSQGDVIHQWFIEGPAKLPAKYLKPSVGALPHHIEIAVDSAEPDSHHRLYHPEAYALQYRIRVNTAVAHIREAYLDNV